MRHKIIDEIKTRVKELYLSNIPIELIATQTGISTGSVANIIKLYDIRKSRSKIIQRKYDYDEIYRLYESGNNSREIAEILGGRKESVSYIVKKLGISRPRKYDYDRVCSLYKKGNSVREVAKLVGGNHRSVANIVKNAGISRVKGPRLHVLRALGNYCKPFDTSFVDYLDGLMISDGSIGSPKPNSICAGYNQSCVHCEWLEVIKNKFLLCGITSNLTLQKRSDCSKKPIWNLRTHYFDQLYLSRQRWYQNGIKIVPKDLNFGSVDFLKNWIYGDGTLCHGTLRLCTDSFKEEEVDYLINSLNNVLDVSFKKCYMGNTIAGQPKFRPALCIKNGLVKFFEYIGECDLECFKYKWYKEKVLPIGNCNQCGNTFLIKTHNKKCCSRKCNNKANFLARKGSLA